MTEQVMFEWSGLGAADANLLLPSLGAIIFGFAIWILFKSISILYGDEEKASKPEKVKP